MTALDPNGLDLPVSDGALSVHRDAKTDEKPAPSSVVTIEEVGAKADDKKPAKGGSAS